MISMTLKATVLGACLAMALPGAGLAQTGGGAGGAAGGAGGGAGGAAGTGGPTLGGGAGGTIPSSPGGAAGSGGANDPAATGTVRGGSVGENQCAAILTNRTMYPADVVAGCEKK